METISVAEARSVEAIGKQVLLRGWVRTRRDSKGGFSFIELNDGSCQATSRSSPTGCLPNYEQRDQEAADRRQRHRRRRGQGVAGQRPGDRGPCHGRRASSATPIRKPIRCRRRATPSSSCARSPISGRGRTPSAPSPACATGCRNRFTNSSTSTASSTSTRRSSPPAIAKGPAQMFRVTTLDLGKPPRHGPGRNRLLPGLLRQAGLPDRQRPARGRDVRLRARQHLHLRADVSGRELEHDAAPGRVLDDRAGDGVLRSERQHDAGRSVHQAHHQGRAGELRRGHEVLRRADRQGRPRHARRTSSTTVHPAVVHGSGGHSARSRARRSSIPSTGARTCSRNTSAF